MNILTSIQTLIPYLSVILQVSNLGCEAFALLFDDIDPELRPVDKTDFKSFAEAQVFVTNKVFETLKHPKFLFCPTG